MLETLRKSTGSLVVKILFGILILSFGVWGIGDMVRGGAGAQPAITVGEVEIGPLYVRQEFQRQVERLRQLFGPDMTSDTARQMGVLDDTISQVVSSATLDMAARDMGIVVTEDALRRAVLQEQAFQVGGTFSRDQFLRVLAANNMTEDRYIASLRDELRRSRLIQPVAVNGAAPQPLAEALFRYRNEGRVAEMLVVDANELPVDGTPAEDDLRAIYESSVDRYTAPQYRRITAVKLSTEDVLSQAEIDETAIADHYAANADLYLQPATRTVSQVIAPDQTSAQAVAEAAQGDSSLAEAASAAGAPAPVSMGAVTAQGLPSEMTDVIFALDEGAVSEPVQSPLGWHVFHVEEATEAQQQPLEAVRDQIRQQIAAEQAVDLLYRESAALEDALGGGATLEEAAESLGLQLFKVGAVDVDGRTQAGEPAPLPDDIREDVVQTAFSLEEGQESLLQETDSGYYVVRVDDIVPAAHRPFEEVRDQVLAQWQAAQRQEQAQALAEKLAEQAEPPATLEPLAQTSSAVSYQRQPAVTRQGQTVDGEAAQIDGDLINRLFSMQPGETAAISTERGAVVLRLAEITAANPSERADAMQDLSESLRTNVAEDVVTQMIGAFSTRYGVEINRQAIEAAF